MSKELSPLEALEKLTNYKCSCMSEKIECKNIIEKSLKAFEIIKEKKVDVDMFMKCKDLDSYNYNIIYWHGNTLTQEEYDLLKEVLL